MPHGLPFSSYSDVVSFFQKVRTLAVVSCCCYWLRVTQPAPPGSWLCVRGVRRRPPPPPSSLFFSLPLPPWLLAPAPPPQLRACLLSGHRWQRGLVLFHLTLLNRRLAGSFQSDTADLDLDLLCGIHALSWVIPIFGSLKHRICRWQDAQTWNRRC